jgi:hypothetical protein
MGFKDGIWGKLGCGLGMLVFFVLAGKGFSRGTGFEWFGGLFQRFSIGIG